MQRPSLKSSETAYTAFEMVSVSSVNGPLSHLPSVRVTQCRGKWTYFRGSLLTSHQPSEENNTLETRLVTQCVNHSTTRVNG
ncbi:hypothetical protein J4Q44_G00042840 [Coregonus suidteri]|uniref:Uncharacterized protein n=1 Tax=Coregonus suidteri TaxID=861788 RepID=A0AAN8ME32_9TELE